MTVVFLDGIPDRLIEAYRALPRRADGGPDMRYAISQDVMWAIYSWSVRREMEARVPH